jgi:uncharacterized membrane protein YfcA
VQLYLPIADLPVNVFLILAMGAAVGFVSGMFGIGGGFLMTPLLIFVGIAPAVAVASVASPIAVTTRRPGSHGWIHGLPLKVRFKRSKIYLSVIPVIVVGLVIGFIGAVMGIGGGFILVPLMIYLLRVPTSTVIGTSMVLTLVTMVFATMLHAVTNHLVDAVLALILMIGGVTGAQFGARAGQKIRGEHLRLLLGLLVLAVGIRFAIELVIRPEDLFTIRESGGGAP